MNPFHEVEAYKFDNADGTSKIWMVWPKTDLTYDAWWGKIDSVLSTKTINGDWRKKVSEKLAKGYYQIGNVRLGNDGRVVFGQTLPEIQPRGLPRRAKKIKPVLPSEVKSFFEEAGEFDF